MKSSTIRRSALSKESMDVIENLANKAPADYSQNSEQPNDYTPSEYHRESETNSTNNKSKEIDLLWQSFKTAQFNAKSPVIHWIGGFILGVVTTLVVVSLFGMFAANSDNSSIKSKLPTLGIQTQEQNVDDVEDASTMVNEQNIPADEVDTPTVVSEEKVTENKKSNKASKEEKIEAKAPIKTKKYVIKDGDTVEAIIKRNYGSYTPERAEAIMKANNLKDLDHISIDQELLLPIEK